MAKHPDLAPIIEMLQQGQNFRIDRKQYIKYTGIDIPQDRNYTEKRSSVAKKAREFGYDLRVIPETLVFTKKE